MKLWQFYNDESGPPKKKTKRLCVQICTLMLLGIGWDWFREKNEMNWTLIMKASLGLIQHCCSPRTWDWENTMRFQFFFLKGSFSVEDSFQSEFRSHNDNSRWIHIPQGFYKILISIQAYENHLTKFSNMQSPLVAFKTFLLLPRWWWISSKFLPCLAAYIFWPNCTKVQVISNAHVLTLKCPRGLD